MSLTQLKLTAIAFAFLSIALLVAAVREWPSRRPDSAGPASERSNRQGGLILFAVSILLVAGLLTFARFLGWSRDRTLWVGLGAFLVLMTLSRPWWFWDNWKARWLRNLIGDEATAAVYLALAGAMLWIGLYTDWTFGRR